MARLKQHVKLFIVQRLAWFDTASEVAVAVKEEFGIDLDRGHVGFYDPTSHKGRELGANLKEYFYNSRKNFLDNFYETPIANKSVRVRELEKLYLKAVKSGNAILAKKLLEQVAKEEGGLFTNKVNLSSDSKTPWFDFYQQICGTSIPVVHDIEGEYEEVEKVTTKPKKTEVITKRKLISRD